MAGSITAIARLQVHIIALLSRFEEAVSTALHQTVIITAIAILCVAIIALLSEEISDTIATTRESAVGIAGVVGACVTIVALFAWV